MNCKRRAPLAAVLAGLVALLVGAGVVQAATVKDGQVIGDSKMSKADQAKLQARIDHVQKARAKNITAEQRAKAAKRLAAEMAAAKAAGNVPKLVSGPGMTPDYFGVANWANSPEIRKFVDKLPGLGPTAKNNLGNYISIAVPDTVTYPGSDYYELSVRQFTQKLHRDLPATQLRGYVQTNKGTDANGNNTVNPSPIMYLGPIIVAQKDRPVRIKFTNELPTGLGGNLFIPVDTTVMGAGMGPIDLPTQPGAAPQREEYTQNRAVIHLHGGHTPWVSDGTPHQWITPAGEQTSYPRGVSMRNVPDMPDPGAGSQTYYFSNQQSARLLFYHDHSFGITRLNVYVGEVSGYVLRDKTEQDLIDRKVIPSDEIPLIIQDKSFVNAKTVRKVDPTWNWGSNPVGADGFVKPKTGDLWYPHVYVPAQNPYTADGVNPYGRWHYGPWFWPPTKDAVQPVPNPYYDPVNAPWEPPENPGVPNVSIPGESFFDVAMVNGVAYPTMTVKPKAYRFRILNGANDRFFNLQMFVANPKVKTRDGRRNTEVKMVPAQATKGWPELWPIDGREGGVPDPKTQGPKWIQIGTEGGFLPYPAVIPNQPVTWNTNPTTFNFGNVVDHSLLIGTAERADVIVDFSKFAGKTIILYNDAPAAFPALDARYDYYTGNPDLRGDGGYKSTRAGYSPNIRTILQIKVAKQTAAKPFNLKRLQAAFTSTTERKSVFERGQNPILVAQATYDKTYNQKFPTAWPLWGYVRIQDNSMTVRTVAGADLPMDLKPKAIQDEMGEAYDEYGRMSGKLGLELPLTSSKTQNFVLQNYVDPTTEVINDSIEPLTPVAGDGTQIWKITHNGVDTHTIHFHLFDVQLLNRVGWDGAIRPPDANEMGWKDTLRVSPLEDTIVALKATASKQPWGSPDSIRPYNPAEPIGSAVGFTNINPTTGQPIVPPTTNQVVNFGWEYVWHCHLLSHEEMDMMRPIQFNVARALAAPPLFAAAYGSGGQPPVSLTWTDVTPWNGTGPKSTLGDPANEMGFRVERAVLTGGVPGPYAILGSALANQTTYTDSTAAAGTDYQYRVVAFNVAGDTASNTVDLIAGTVSPAAPTNLIRSVQIGPAVALQWADNATGETGYVISRSTNRGAFTPLVTLAADATTYLDATVAYNTEYDYVVQAVNGTVASLLSNTVRVTLNASPTTPANVTAKIARTSAGPDAVTLTWTQTDNTVIGSTVQRATDAAFTKDAKSFAISTDATTFTDTVDHGFTYYYRVSATSAVAMSPWSDADWVETVPAVPGNFRSAGRTSVAVKLAWKDTSANEDNFQIQRRRGTGVWKYVQTTAANVKTFTNKGLMSDMAYQFRARAKNGIGISPWTPVVKVKTLP